MPFQNPHSWPHFRPRGARRRNLEPGILISFPGDSDEPMGGSLLHCVGVFGPRLPPWGLAPQAIPFVPSCPPTLALHPSTCRNLSSEVFCFMSQLLLSFFTPSFPGASQEHSPDILKLLAPHPRLKEHVESLATEGTSHNLPKLSQVKLHSPSSLLTLRLTVLWADVESEPSPSYFGFQERRNGSC